jgi:hypothetical protein
VPRAVRGWPDNGDEQHDAWQSSIHEVFAMSPELDHQLCTRYPEIFARRHDPDAPIAFGIETCDCWFDLLDALCTSLQWATRQGDPQVVAVQVKEKFRGLRFYCDAISARQEGMVMLAGHLSGHLCAGHCGRQRPPVGTGSVNQD